MTTERYPLEGHECFPNLQAVGFLNAISLASFDCYIECPDGRVDILRIYFNPDDWHQPNRDHYAVQTKLFVTQVADGYTVDYSTVHNNYVTNIQSR